VRANIERYLRADVKRVAVRTSRAATLPPRESGRDARTSKWRRAAPQSPATKPSRPCGEKLRTQPHKRMLTSNLLGGVLGPSDYVLECSCFYFPGCASLARLAKAALKLGHHRPLAQPHDRLARAVEGVGAVVGVYRHGNG